MKRGKIGGLFVIIITIAIITTLHADPVHISAVDIDTTKTSQAITKVSEKINSFATPLINRLLKAAGYPAQNEELDSDQAELIEASLESVVDGDTIWVNISGERKKVRLLSINTEESVSSDKSRNNEYGKKASNFAKKYLSDYKTVWLEYDTERTDPYGRELCYVWLDNQIKTDNPSDIKKYMFNAILLRKGYAYTTIYEPNHKNEKFFKQVEQQARAEKTGLWKYEEFEKIADQRQN